MTDDDDIELLIELDRIRLREYRKTAEEIVRDHGWNEKDDDFQFQIEQEIKRLWSEDAEREFNRRRIYEDFDEPLDQ